jgi:hypothetical protein
MRRRKKKKKKSMGRKRRKRKSHRLNLLRNPLPLLPSVAVARVSHPRMSPLLSLRRRAETSRRRRRGAGQLRRTRRSRASLLEGSRSARRRSARARPVVTTSKLVSTQRVVVAWGYLYSNTTELDLVFVSLLIPVPSFTLCL